MLNVLHGTVNANKEPLFLRVYMRTLTNTHGFWGAANESDGVYRLHTASESTSVGLWGKNASVCETARPSWDQKLKKI